MVFTRRVQTGTLKRKPRLTLDVRKFPFANDLKLGEKGQIDAMVTVLDIDKVQDEGYNELLEIVLLVEEADILDTKQAREINGSSVQKTA